MPGDKEEHVCLGGCGKVTTHPSEICNACAGDRSDQSERCKVCGARIKSASVRWHAGKCRKCRTQEEEGDG